MPATTRRTLRRCFRPPIPEVAVAQNYLDNAVTAHLEGRREDAVELLRLADISVIRDWTDSLWGKKSQPNECLSTGSGVGA